MAGPTRRAFLQHAGALAGVAVAAGAFVPVAAATPGGPRWSSSRPGDVAAVARTAAELELVAVAAYDRAITTGALRTPELQAVARRFGASHRAHADAFIRLGGLVSSEVAPDRDALAGAVEQLAAARSEADVLAIALGLENAAVALYVNGLAVVEDRAAIDAMASILPIESAHATVIGRALDLAADDPRFLPAFER